MDKPSTISEVVVVMAPFTFVTATSRELVRRIVLKAVFGQPSKIRHCNHNSSKVREHLRRVDDHDLWRRIPGRGTGGVGIEVGSSGFQGREYSLLEKLQTPQTCCWPLNR